MPTVKRIYDRAEFTGEVEVDTINESTSGAGVTVDGVKPKNTASQASTNATDITTLQDDKANKVSGATDGNVATLDANGDLQDSGIDSTDLVTTADVSGKADKVLGATTGNLAGLDASGNLQDAGKTPQDITDNASNITTLQNNKADKVTNATSGNLASIDVNGNLQDAGTAPSAITTNATNISNHVSSTSNPHATDVANLGAGTLSELNAIITDATLDDSSASRTPTTHATTHQDGGSDTIKLDALASPDDNTNLNATTSAHGLLPKLSGTSTDVLKGDGTWGSGGTGAGDMEIATYDPNGVSEQLVGITATQTLTNKTLTSPSINTPTGITKNDVGLGNVDNTADLDKPVSTATQTELNKKLDIDGGNSMESSLNMGSHTIINVSDGVNDGDAVNKGQLDNSTSIVKVSSNDTTAGYLNGKLVAGTNITFTEGNDGGNETLTINVSSGTSTDTDAIHDNVAGEIAAITEKTTPVGDDLILIEDSEDSDNKKKLKINNLPSSGGATIDDTAWSGNNWDSTVSGISADKIEGALEEVGVRYADRASEITSADNGKILQAYYNDDGSTITQDFRLSDKTVDDMGGGDMLKSVYDTNDSGVVDNSEKLGGELPAYYTPASNVLTLDNTTAFTPNADYEPATKKYVDDSGGGLSWSATTSSTTVADKQGYLCDASSSAITLTCPASPTIGDVFGVVVLDITNTLSIDGNGNNVTGSTSLELDIVDAGMQFVYTSKGWKIASEINAGKTPTIADNPNNQTGTAYTLQLSDAGKTVYMNNTSENTVTIPQNAVVAFDINTVVCVVQEGGGLTYIHAESPCTLNGVDGDTVTIAKQYNACELIKRGLNSWTVIGGIA